jgi:hypothetical protein
MILAVERMVPMALLLLPAGFHGVLQVDDIARGRWNCAVLLQMWAGLHASCRCLHAVRQLPL